MSLSWELKGLQSLHFTLWLLGDVSCADNGYLPQAVVEVTQTSTTKVYQQCNKYIFLYSRTNILFRRQAFASLQHGFLRSKENVALYNFETPKRCRGKIFFQLIIFFLIFCKIIFKADVMPFFN